MTETTQPAPDPSITAPSVQDAQTGPAVTDPPAEKPAKAPRKRAASKTADIKAPEPAPENEKRDSRALYLLALPEDFAYTTVTATGANGETITISPDQPTGYLLSFEGQGLNRDQHYDDVKDAVAGAAKAAKAMSKIAAREAELAKVREEALDF